MYPTEQVFPSVIMWQRVLRIRACMYQDEQPQKPLAETEESPNESSSTDIDEQQASWTLWMERIHNAHMLLLNSNQQELNQAETIDNVLETLLDCEEWEDFDKFNDDGSGFKDFGRVR